MTIKIFESEHDELFGEYAHMLEKPHQYSKEDHAAMKQKVHKKFGAVASRHLHNAAEHYVAGNFGKAKDSYSRFERHINEAHVMQVKGEEGHSYEKWGYHRGGIEAWKKKSVEKHHGTDVKYTESGEGEFKKTHAHVGDKKVGQYSHYNDSSKTLVKEDVMNEAGFEAQKWGYNSGNGGIKGWKASMEKKHGKGVKYSESRTSDGIVRHTYAHVGGKKVNGFLHHDETSEDIKEAYTPSKSLEGRTKYIVQPQLSQMLKDRLEARKKKGKKKGYTPSAGTLGLAAARKAQMSGSKKKVSEEVETLIEVKDKKNLKRKYLGTLKGRTATGKKAHAIDVKPTVDLKSKV